MSVKASNWAWDQRLKPAQLLVLLRLADFANEYGRCFASYERLTRDVNVSKNTIIKALSDLEDGGYIEKIKNLRDNGGFAANSFVLNMFPKSSDIASAETEQGVVQPAEQGVVQPVEQGKELTSEQKKEKKKKKNNATASSFDPSRASQADWHKYLSTLKREPYRPSHSSVCMCSPCRINKNYKTYKNNLKKMDA